MTTDSQRNEEVAQHPAIIFLAALQIITGLQIMYTAISSFLLATKANTSEFEQEILARLPAALSPYMVQIILTFGAVSFLIGVLCLFTARGYLRGSERARIRGIRIAAIAIIIGIIGFIVLPTKLDVSSPFLIIMFNLAIILYLHRPKVQSYFGARK